MFNIKNNSIKAHGKVKDLEYNVLENVIQVRHIDRIGYDKLQYETRLKVEAQIQKKEHSYNGSIYRLK